MLRDLVNSEKIFLSVKILTTISKILKLKNTSGKYFCSLLIASCRAPFVDKYFYRTKLSKEVVSIDDFLKCFVKFLCCRITEPLNFVLL